MIYTSYYDICDPRDTRYNLCSISGDRGKRVGFTGGYCRELAPRMSFWEPWHNNIGQISDRANNEFYIEQYWEEVLSHLNANTIYEKFDNPYIPTILLCYESHGFCHRHIASAWLELETGIKVPEIKFGKNGRIEIADRPWWIKEYLQHIMAL